MFRAGLVAALAYSDGAKGWPAAFDPVMMFKILVIAAMDNLSDERAEFLINDRMSFMRFLGLALADRVPDARTIWLFREKLTKAGAIEALFERFDAALRASGYIAMSGQIVDATLVAVPRQRNTDEEKKAIKECGRTRPIARRPMRRSWKRPASSAAFIARNQREDPCPRRCAGPTPPNRRFALMSSTCSPNRKTG